MLKRRTTITWENFVAHPIVNTRIILLSSEAAHHTSLLIVLTVSLGTYTRLTEKRFEELNHLHIEG